MNKPLKIPATTLEQQFASSNPENSSWVSANAGSGKTHVLTQRVIRLMLSGCPPDRILCLTFTKAAAANMKNRVFDTLAKWTMMPDEDLDNAIKAVSGEASDNVLRNKARTLFASALDTPGGLKIQTIHAFCESLLHQFPLEANVPGHFETIQEMEQAELLKQARSDVLGGLANSEGIAAHYQALVPYVSDSAIEKGLTAIVSMRREFREWAVDGIENAVSPLFETLGIRPEDTEESIIRQTVKTLPATREKLAGIIAIAQKGTKKTDLDFAEKLSAIDSGNNHPEQTFECLKEALLTAKNTAKVSPVTGDVTNVVPDAIEALHECAAHIISGMDKLSALQLVTISGHLFKIGYAVVERYERLKKSAGLIDFDDQIEKSANLLNRSDIRDWIRYRLDRGVDHVLVDEAQDTSPAQWQIINAITEDFHAGETASPTNRTVFVVGDEKQSIYSFQGARPEEFSRQQKGLEKRIGAVGRAYHNGKLDLSFRSTVDVLQAVDLVFENEQNRKGLTRSGERPVHGSIREKAPGEVHVWPLYVKEDSSNTESWLDPVDKQSPEDPAVKLAKRISATVRQWVGTISPSTGKVIRHRDILVLLRKRDRFLTALTRTMKDQGVTVAGADRLKLTDHIAVEDLLAIGRMALLPEDDLTLASVLKSIFFNVDENTLFELAHSRGKTGLYSRLRVLASDSGSPHTAMAGEIVEKLQGIIRLSKEQDVFGFYARFLAEMGGRKAVLARLGTEAEDVVDAFLEEALAFHRDKGRGLESFISRIIRTEPEIKREVELERDEVRILTVHSAKGLEAPIVFLVDPCSPAWSELHRPPLLEIETGRGRFGYLWLPDKSLHIPETGASVEKLEKAAEAEYRRLLYVGMTRAADRLIVCGYRGKNPPKHSHWHQMVHDALQDTATKVQDADGHETGLRWVKSERDPLSPKDAPDEVNLPVMDELPEWLVKPAKSDPPLPRPLTPSGAHALIDRESTTGEALNTIVDIESNRFALEKGIATHRLLEVLPEMESSQRETAVSNYLDRVGSNWSSAQRNEIAANVLRILNMDLFSVSRGEFSQAEVALAGRLDGKAGSYLVTGQIDRLTVTDKRVTILDYKTNRDVPASPEQVDTGYVSQLALYRELVRQIYPEREIISALLWTQDPSLMIMPDKLLDEALHAIKKG